MKRPKRRARAKGSRPKRAPAHRVPVQATPAEARSAQATSPQAKPAQDPPALALRAREAARAMASWARETYGTTFPIVGIGASAGGLEALEQFLRNVPPDSGIAFVVVQHLDPLHKGAMVELLGRASSIPVVQIKDRMKVVRDHVYVIPPNSDLSILHGTLHLLAPAAPRGHNLPIDFFFRSLADDQKERAIGVVLSGMGTDGTLGLRAIKENAGACFVQAIGSARFDGMPSSAIDAGLADAVGPADKLPAMILNYLRHVPLMAVRDVKVEERAQSSLEKVFVLMRAQTGNDFSLYKRSTILRRIERRMGLLQIDQIGKYVHRLRENPREIELLFKELLIGVTSFFRDPEAWEQLGKAMVPAILSSRSDAVLRAWVPGCSTGEEAFSLAMIFRETMGRLRPIKKVVLQIFATDLDRDAIESARTGLYPANIAADVTPERLHRFFAQEEHGYRVSQAIREMVVFAPQNLIVDPPFTKLEILSCRNVLIYFAPELQKKLIPLFHYSLSRGGLLFLGSAETVGAYNSRFEPLDGKMRLYRRRELSIAAAPAEFRSPFSAPQGHYGNGQPDVHPMDRPASNVQALADRVLVQRFSPVGIVCNEKGDILYISGKSGKYLEPVAGKADWNVIAMARDGLRFPLSTAFSSALRSDRTITVRAVKVSTEGGGKVVDITVEKLIEPDQLRGTLMVVIAEVSSQKGERASTRASTRGRTRGLRIEELEKELRHTREETQIVREEMQTSQEELKSTNEELQSTNEELQSTNEELTTSKEEMQSMNEELQTVNHELQSKVDELSRSNNDMKNLLNSTDIATLFLDASLNVRRFTTPTAKIIRLLASDAGRPISDFATEIQYPGLVDDAKDVLYTLLPHEEVVAARDGRWFVVRMLPYRTLDNVIDGVVITFTDATASKQLEHTLRDQASQLRQMADALTNLIWSFRPDGACDYVGPQWEKYTGVPAADLVGYAWLELLHPDDRERARAGWNAALKASSDFIIEFRVRERNGEYRWFQSRTVPIRDAQGVVVKWYGSSTDIHAFKSPDESP
jgi:two-component system CheB/CheR fusion protein